MLNIISLGAGVQSTTMLMMSTIGELPKADGAIFADTGMEPSYVYDQINKLKKIINIPLYVVKADFKDNYGDIQTHTMKAIEGKTARYSGPPAYMDKGFIRRQCTNDYKIQPIRKKVRELLGLKKGQRGGKEIKVKQWIGISLDEMNRMRESRDAYVENIFPLIDKRMRRFDCLNWMAKNGFALPKKSACIFCPYHNNQTWQEMKESRQEDFKIAVEIDHKLRKPHTNKYPFDKPLYLHPSLQPLDEVDFGKKKNQIEMFGDMGDECEGMCGV